MTLTFGSLFAGVGGYDLGFEMARYECKFQVEWDKHCRSVLDYNWPDVPKWGDIRNVDGRFLPPVDVIIFGSPCQDLSVAGKRAGLEGERSGLFHEAVRIIKEMRNATNGTFPRWTVWENVAGALSSNNGRDFGTVINEMAKAGACLQEYALLDAQYFGVPQRRRRVFLVSCFDPATAERCPDPLLPVRESLPGDTKKGKPKEQSAATETSESIGTGSEWWDGGQIADALTTTSNEQRMPDKQRLQAVVESFTPSSFANYTEGVGTLRSNGGDLGGGSETLVAEPMLSFDTQFGSNANVFEDQSPTLKASQQSPSVAYPIDTRNALRDPEKYDAQNRQGLGIGEDGDPMATLTSTHVNAVAYGITGNAIGRQDHNGPNGPSHTPENGPMFTLTSTDIHAVAYDEYNDSINEVHHALRAGTKQSTGVLVENDVAATLRSGGSGGVPSSRGEHLVTEPTVFEPGAMARLGNRAWEGIAPTLRANAGDNHPHIQIHNVEPTMAVRRLTPLECERLMGWPDDHTRWKADGTEQADTHRYKQCGNGVASPVAKWVAQQIAKVEYAEG